MTNQIDFKSLAQDLLVRSRDLVPTWFPDGKLRGREWVVGNLSGSNGDSLSINLDTGLWADFADSEKKGGDLISLFAAKENISQLEAAKQLAEQTGWEYKTNAEEVVTPEPIIDPRPPVDVEPPDMVHGMYGSPSMTWCYRDYDGNHLFYVARYETPNGKVFSPYSWHEGQWKMKGYPSPRPLYGMEMLKNTSKRWILIVEGEKTADAAKRLLGSTYVVLTWHGGVNSIYRNDWSPLKGFSVLIWPDNDEAGIKAGYLIGKIAQEICPMVRLIDPSNRPLKWDAADAEAEGLTKDDIVAWARQRTLQLWPEKPKAVPVEVDSDNHIRAVAVAKSGDNTAAVALDINPQPPISESAAQLCQKYDLRMSQDKPVAQIENVLYALNQIPDFKNIVWYDSFQQRILTKWNSEYVRAWRDVDDINLTIAFQKCLGFWKLSDDLVHKAVISYAFSHEKSEISDWLNSLVWDGQERIENFMINYFNVLPSDYVKAVSKNWFLSMVARALRPGSKVDNMVVLEGVQGSFKSTSLQVLVGKKWFAEAHESPLSKDFYMCLTGKLIIEIGELDSFRRVEETLIKRLLACDTDRYRIPYGEFPADYPRQCIFVGTTNESYYLRDTTGARRFWPVKVEHIELDRIAADREQFFAEAVALYKNGATWHEMPAETKLEQEKRREVDVWEDQIKTYLENNLIHQTSILEIANDCLKIEISKVDMSCQRRIGKVLGLLGWFRVRVSDDLIGCGRRWVWRSGDFYGNEIPADED